MQEAFAAAGAVIVFNDINQELVDKGLKAYAERGIDAKGYVCDVTSEEAVQALVKQIEKEIGVIDILVNNAEFVTISFFVFIKTTTFVRGKFPTLDLIAQK